VKRRLGWRKVSRDELAAHLREVEILAAEAIDETSVYRCQGAGGGSIVVSLPGGNGLIVQSELALDPALERRRSGSNSPLDE
jgi:hypothetical protein